MYSRVVVINLGKFYLETEVLLNKLPFHLSETLDLPNYIQELAYMSMGRIGTIDMMRETELYTHLVGSDLFPMATEEFLYEVIEAFNRHLWNGYRLRLFYTQHLVSFPNRNVMYVREMDNSHLGMAL